MSVAPEESDRLIRIDDEVKRRAGLVWRPVASLAASSLERVGLVARRGDSHANTAGHAQIDVETLRNARLSRGMGEDGSQRLPESARSFSDRRLVATTARQPQSRR